MRKIEISIPSFAVVLIIFFVVYSLKDSIGDNYGHLDEDTKKDLFDSFIIGYRRYYTDEEYEHRYNVFKDNLKLIDSRNQNEMIAGGTAIHDINRFTDLSMEECQRFFLGISVNLNTNYETDKRYIHESSLNASGNETFVNWTGIYTTDIKDQLYCASCAAFGAVEQVESDSIRLQGWKKGYSLSPQQLVDCVPSSQGCLGGNIFDIYKYIKIKGLELDNDYPYTGDSGNSSFKKGNSQVKIKSFLFMNHDNPSRYAAVEMQMTNYVLTTGPLSIHVDGTVWLTYVSGILSYCTTYINHVAQIVGVDTFNKYWIVRNSWGTSWGEGGYIRLQHMTNQCKLASYPSSVITIVANKNITMSPTTVPYSEPTSLPTSKPTFKPKRRSS